MEMQKCELLSGINHFIKYAPGPGTCRPRAEEASGLKSCILAVPQTSPGSVALGVFKMPSLKRKVWLPGLWSSDLMTSFFVSLKESIPILQNSKSLFTHSLKESKCAEGWTHRTGSRACKLCRSQPDLLYLYIWRKKFTEWAFVTNKMGLTQMMVIYFIKSTLKDICLLGAAGNSCRSERSSSRVASRGFQGTASPSSTGLLHSRQPCGWTACVPELMVQVRLGCKADSHILPVPACWPHPCSKCGISCVHSACTKEGEPACLDY